MDEDTKPCPVCGETIKSVALKCRFCNTDLAAFAAAKELETEKDLFVGHPAMIYSIGQLMPFVAALAVTVLVAYFHDNLGVDVGYVILAFILVSGGIALSYYFTARGRHFEITTQRIKLERGMLSKVQESLELFRIDHFELRKPLGMRMLGQSSLRVFTSDAELTNFHIYGIPRLEELSDTLRECQLRERTRRGLSTFVKA